MQESWFTYNRSEIFQLGWLRCLKDDIWRADFSSVVQRPYFHKFNLCNCRIQLYIFGVL